MAKYKNFLFDLDGTMYDIVWDVYKNAYFNDEAQEANKLYGIDKQKVFDLLDYTHNNIIGTLKKLNYSKQQIVYFYIAEKLNLTFEQVACIFDNSASENIKRIQNSCIRLLNGVIKASVYLKNKGYRVFLATNSYFSRKRILERLAWTGLKSDMFEFVNDWSQTDSVKPDEKFFDDIVQKFNLKKSECLMVGNDKFQDGGCLRAGIDMYLITDCIESPEAELNPTYQGSSDDFYRFITSNF